MAPDLKRRIADEVDARGADLDALARQLHARPELGFAEHFAASTLTAYVEGAGLSVRRGPAGLETSFVAEFGHGGPVVAILAEYDALPELGHACGHNLIAAAAIGAFLALHGVVREPGRVRLIGCPAEEHGDGKIALLRDGLFADVDAALMAHPGDQDEADPITLAMTTLDVAFAGRAAHAASEPHSGINALDALMLAWNAIAALRLVIRSDSRIHGIVLDGGTAANVIPERTSARLMVRSPDSAYLAELRARVLSSFQGAARATGCDLSYTWSTSCEAVRTNRPLAEAYVANMHALGGAMSWRLSQAHGSTDMGNVTVAVPGIHPFFSIVDVPTPAHSREFALAATAPPAFVSTRRAAKALAMTALDALVDPALLRSTKEAFGER